MTTTVTGDRISLGPYVVGEVPEPWIHQIQDVNGTAVNLTGYTVSVTFTKPDGTVVTRAGALVVAANGTVRVTWQATDFNQAGLLRGRLTVDNGGSHVASTRFVARIRS